MRESLLDDTGIDLACDLPCGKCKYEGSEVINNQTWFKCLAPFEVCEFEEKNNDSSTVN